MRHPMVVRGALALGVSACAGSAALPADMIVIGKCSFTDRTTPDVEVDDVFLYALRNEANGELAVVTGTATTTDSLHDAIARQSADAILPARRRDPARLEFGGLTAERAGEADYFVSMGSQPGELFTSIGGTYGTPIAYPTCVFWE